MRPKRIKNSAKKKPLKKFQPKRQEEKAKEIPAGVQNNPDENNDDNHDNDENESQQDGILESTGTDYISWDSVTRDSGKQAQDKPTEINDDDSDSESELSKIRDSEIPGRSPTKSSTKYSPVKSAQENASGKEAKSHTKENEIFLF